jgi:hypothetical protein
MSKNREKSDHNNDPWCLSNNKNGRLDLFKIPTVDLEARNKNIGFVAVLNNGVSQPYISMVTTLSSETMSSMASASQRDQSFGKKCQI